METKLHGGPSLHEEEPVVDPQQAAVRALRRFIQRHNWQALTLALFSFVTAAVLWGLIYLFAYWFNLIAVTIVLGSDARTLLEVTDPNLVSGQFPRWFLAGAVLALAIAGTVRHKLRLERLREARHYFLWVVVELLMAVPNVTFSVWGNLSALVWLPEREAASAWRLLQRLHLEGGRVSVTGLRLEIEDERTLGRVMFALQLVGLADMRERTEGWYFCLQNPDAFAQLSSAAEAAAA